MYSAKAYIAYIYCTAHTLTIAFKSLIGPDQFAFSHNITLLQIQVHITREHEIYNFCHLAAFESVIS